MRIQLKRSSTVENGSAKQPSASQLEYGELAVNFNDVDPAIFFKDSGGQIVRVTGDGAVGSGNAEIEFTSGPGLYITNPVFTLDQQTDQTIDVNIILDSDAERVGLEKVTDTTLSGGYLRAKTATPTEKGVIKEPSGVGIYMRQVKSDGSFEWVSKDATISLPPGYPDLTDGKGNSLDNRYLNKNIDQTFTGTTLTISQNLTVGGTTSVNNLTATGTITGDVTGDLTGNADTADQADNADNATNAETAANLTRSVIAGDGLTGGGELTADRTLDVGAADATIIVEADGIRVDQAQLNFTPAANNGEINIGASNGLEATGSNATANQSGNTTRTISGINATTSVKGVVQLKNSVTSTSNTTAATPKSVKTAYDRAEEYAPAKDGTNATGTWDIDITGNAATADVAAACTGSIDSAVEADQAGMLRVYESAGDVNRPFVFLASNSGSSGDPRTFYRDTNLNTYINPGTDTIGAVNFLGTSGTFTSNVRANTAVYSPRFTNDASITIQPEGTTTGRSVSIFPGADDDNIAGNIIIGKGATDGTGGKLYFRGYNGSSSNQTYRFAKPGQTSIEGFLDFTDLSEDKIYTFPDYTGTVALTNNGIYDHILFANNEADDIVTGDGTVMFDSSQGLIVYRTQQNVSGAVVTVLDGANVSAGDGITISNLGSGTSGSGSGTTKFIFAVDDTVVRTDGSGVAPIATTANNVKITANTSNSWRDIVLSATGGASSDSQSLLIAGASATGINTSTGKIKANQYLVNNGGNIEEVTGEYGNVQISGSNKNAGSYSGLSLEGKAVFMNSGSKFGLYDDVNNDWAIEYTRLGDTRLFYSGVERFRVKQSGASVQGDFEVENDGYLEVDKVALSNNDGQGNANITFNHNQGVPVRDGSSARITALTDSTSAKLSFEVKNSVTAGVSASTTEKAYVDSTGFYATKFFGPLEGDVTGNLTGNVTGDVTGSITGNVNGDVTGNASSATKLKTSRTLWGKSFDGTANVSGSLTSVNSITGANATMTIQPADSTTARTLVLRGNNDTDGTGGAVTIGDTGRGVISFRTSNSTGYRFTKPGNASIYGAFDLTDLSASRIYKWQNTSGTVAFTKDIDDAVAGGITGNAASATKLQTARTLWGQSFDGTANVTGDITGVSKITGNNANMTIEPKDSTTARALYLRGNNDTDGTGGNVFIGHEGRGAIYFRSSTNNTAYRFYKKGTTNIYGALKMDSLTANRQYTFPNSTGTIALTTSKVDDADKLDGIQGSSYARSDADDTISGTYKFTKNGTNQIRLNKGSTTAYSGVTWSEVDDDRFLFYMNNVADGSLNLQSRKNGSNIKSVFSVSNSDGVMNFGVEPTIQNNKVWHAGNDGSGSGLDADKLDGLSSGSFLRSNTNDTASGSITFSNNIKVSSIIGRGTQITIDAGEATGKFSSQTAEAVYVNAEAGFRVTTPDRAHANFESGYSADITHIRGDAIGINNSNPEEALDIKNGCLLVRPFGNNTGNSNWWAKSSITTRTDFGVGLGMRVISSTANTYEMTFGTMSGASGGLKIRARLTHDGLFGVLHDGSSGVEGCLYANSDTKQQFCAAGRTGDPKYPCYGFAGQTGDNGSRGTGMYLVADNVLGFSTGGSRRVVINNSGFIGMGTQSPQGYIDIYEPTAASDRPQIRIAAYRNAIRMVDLSTNANSGEINLDANRFEFRISKEVNATTKLTTRMTLTSGGNLTCTGNVTAYSDIRLKKAIQPIENAVEKVQQIRGVTFERTDAEEENVGKRHAGVIAQEVEKVLPEVVTDLDGTKTVAYGNLVGLLIEAIKDQQKQIDALKEKLED